MYFCLPATSDTERTSDRKNHHESEKDLRNPLHRIEETLNRFGVFWHTRTGVLAKTCHRHSSQKILSRTFRVTRIRFRRTDFPDETVLHQPPSDRHRRVLFSFPP